MMKKEIRNLTRLKTYNYENKVDILPEKGVIFSLNTSKRTLVLDQENQT